VTCDDTRLRPHWLTAIRRYLVAVSLGNLAWEAAQLPLYTLWAMDTPSEIAAAVFHCLLGDVVIASVALMLALAFMGSWGWPDKKFREVATAVIAFGVGYTTHSEYVNTVMRQSWAYAEVMPRLPMIGTGLAPLMQWLIIPPLALIWACRSTPPNAEGTTLRGLMRLANSVRPGTSHIK
jgi:hypothetical protein